MSNGQNKKAAPGLRALQRLQVFFPQVQKVVDSDDAVVVEVTPEDGAKAKANDPMRCALARACKRLGLADAAVIGVGYSYLIKDKTATRYKTSVTVAREITSFDRHKEFAPARDYLLSAVPPANRLDFPSTKKYGPKLTKRSEPIVIRHHTVRVRKRMV